jgi:hypothetical protein
MAKAHVMILLHETRPSPSHLPIIRRRHVPPVLGAILARALVDIGKGSVWHHAKEGIHT